MHEERTGGAGVYARLGLGWAGGNGSWPWRSEALELERAGDVPGQGPAAAESNGVAQAGGAEPGADIAGGFGEGEAELWSRRHQVWSGSR